MPIETRIDRERGLVTHRIMTAPTPDEVEMALERVSGDPAGAAGYPVLWDARLAPVAEATPADIRKMADATVARAATLGRGRTAILATPGAAFGMGRMYELMTADRIGRDLRVFDQPDAAMEWLLEAE